MEPIITNKRLIQQEGLFLYGADFKSNFLRNLYQCPNEEVNSILDNPTKIDISDYEKDKETLAKKLDKSRSIKIIIPQDLKVYIRQELEAMNINMRQLFPDIYGLVRHHYHE